MRRLSGLLLLLFSGLLMAACATSSEVVGRTYPEMPQKMPQAPEISPPPPVQETDPQEIVQQIKRNGNDIKKYFFLDENGQIHIKADLQHTSGKFEVSYDLDNAEILADSAYNIRFSAREIDSNTIIEDSLVWKPGPCSSGLLLSLDDAYIENWERYFALFDAYDARLTFFIQGEYTPFSNKALQQGHDVGYHSLNHPDLRKITRTNFAMETIEPLKAFKSQGVTISSFAFPFGFSEPWMRETLLESFRILRGYGTTFRLYTKDEIRSGYIISKAIDNIVIRDEHDFNRLITLMLRTVKFLEADLVLPLTTHDISDTADWGITPRRLEFLLKTAAELDLKFYRYCDFY